MRIPVYFMPGMAASSRIFERLKFSEEIFDVHLLEWEMPISKESLGDYAKRIASKITEPNPVLVGVSFGGILVQEMAELVGARKVILISSVKCNKEFPLRMRFAKFTKLYKVFPTGLLAHIEKVKGWPLGAKAKERLDLYEQFFLRREKEYLDWSLECILQWNRSEPIPGLLHIHGDADEVFPIQYVKDKIVVPKGTHIMIWTRYRWMNANLSKIILENYTKNISYESV